MNKSSNQSAEHDFQLPFLTGFFKLESAGGILLMATAVLAIIVAN
jgi:Na+/H+ antiporter NhaA